MAKKPRRVKCKFCKWSTQALYRVRGTDKTISGMSRLMRHIDLEHPKDMQRIFEAGEKHYIARRKQMKTV